MDSVFLTRMPAGVPGDVMRKEAARIEPAQYDPDYPVTQYGLPVKKVSGKIRPMAEDDDGQPFGFLVRPYPMQTQANEALGAATPPTEGIADVLVAGYILVDVAGGTSGDGEDVYYAATQVSPEILMGRVQADSGVAITGARFIGTADDNGISEIAYNV